MLRKLRNYFIRRATAQDLGKKVAILWNPQGVKDFGEEKSWREGVIYYVYSDGGFYLKFSDAHMFVSAIYYGRRKNPFKNLIEL